MKKMIAAAVVSGIIGIAVAFGLMYYVYNSAWIVLSVPGIMGMGIRKFGKIPFDELKDEDNAARIERTAGLLCALITAGFATVVFLPSLLVYGPAALLNIGGIAVLAASIFVGWKTGVGCVTDAYYDGFAEENND